MGNFFRTLLWGSLLLTTAANAAEKYAAANAADDAKLKNIMIRQNTVVAFPPSDPGAITEMVLTDGQEARISVSYNRNTSFAGVPGVVIRSPLSENSGAARIELHFQHPTQGAMLAGQGACSSQCAIYLGLNPTVPGVASQLIMGGSREELFLNGVFEVRLVDSVGQVLKSMMFKATPAIQGYY